MNRSSDPGLAALVAAEHKALALLDAIEARGFIKSGRTELEIERDIFTLAARDFGVTAHWHDRVVRAGINTLCVAGDSAPDRRIAEDDMVFLDLGPVFDGWEADVGRSYAVGSDAKKHALCADLPTVFGAVKARFDADDDMTGAALYAVAHAEAEQRGWLFGGRIAGHLVGDFPHELIPGERIGSYIMKGSQTLLQARDSAGRRLHWILEIHLVDRAREIGGFYEQLLTLR